MAQGFAIPVRAVKGRVVLSKGPDKTLETIILSVLENGSTNPFLRPGMQPVIFRLMDSQTRASIERHIKDRFRIFEREEHRARLISVSFAPDNEVGELRVQIRYVDLEDKAERQIDRRIGGLRG